MNHKTVLLFSLLTWLMLSILPMKTPAQNPELGTRQDEISVFLRLSKSFVDDLLDETVKLSMPIDRRVQRIPIKGSARGKAKINVEFIASDDKAQFEIVLTGDVEAAFGADAGPASASASCRAPFLSRKKISFSGEEFVQQPAATEIEIKVSVDQICSKRSGLIGRIVRRVAGRMIERNKSKIDQTVGEIAKDMINKNIDNRADQLLNELNQLDLYSETIEKYFPETKQDQLHARTTQTHMLAGFGPKAAQFPEFILQLKDGDDSQLELWIRTRPIEEEMIKLLVDWEVVHDLLKEFLPKEDAKAIAENLKVDSKNGWTVVRIGSQSATK